MLVTAGQSHTKRPRQRIALLTTLIFLWLSAGATLTHTDSCFDCFPASHSAPKNYVTPGPVSSEGVLPCAACEWSAINVLAPIVFVLVLAFVVIREQRSIRLTDAVRRLITFASLRAPPCLL